MQTVLYPIAKAILPGLIHVSFLRQKMWDYFMIHPVNIHQTRSNAEQQVTRWQPLYDPPAVVLTINIFGATDMINSLIIYSLVANIQKNDDLCRRNVARSTDAGHISLSQRWRCLISRHAYGNSRFICSKKYNETWRHLASVFLPRDAYA